MQQQHLMNHPHSRIVLQVLEWEVVHWHLEAHNYLVSFLRIRLGGTLPLSRGDTIEVRVGNVAEAILSVDVGVLET